MANNTIKSFENFNELNSFLATNNCIVRSIDPGACKIYVELELVENTNNTNTNTNTTKTNEEWIDEFLRLDFLKLNSSGCIDYDIENVRNLGRYIKLSCGEKADAIALAVMSKAKFSIYAERALLDSIM